MPASYRAANYNYSNQTKKDNIICKQVLLKMHCSIGTHTQLPHPTPYMVSQLSAEGVDLLNNICCAIPRHQNRALNSADLFKCKLIKCEKVFVLLASK